jgi:ElaB/YqjD/DUF883 family membrane-anchored ribosome-binding protein
MLKNSDKLATPFNYSVKGKNVKPLKESIALTSRKTLKDLRQKKVDETTLLQENAKITNDNLGFKVKQREERKLSKLKETFQENLVQDFTCNALAEIYLESLALDYFYVEEHKDELKEFAFKTFNALYETEVLFIEENIDNELFNNILESSKEIATFLTEQRFLLQEDTEYINLRNNMWNDFKAVIVAETTAFALDTKFKVESIIAEEVKVSEEIESLKEDIEQDKVLKEENTDHKIDYFKINKLRKLLNENRTKFNKINEHVTKRYLANESDTDNVNIKNIMIETVKFYNFMELLENADLFSIPNESLNVLLT